MQNMKRFDKSGERRILNKSMTQKAREDRYYNRLETQIEAHANKNSGPVRKPSIEEIMTYIDVEKDLFRAYEDHSKLKNFSQESR